MTRSLLKAHLMFSSTVDMGRANFLEMTTEMYMNNQCRILLYITVLKKHVEVYSTQIKSDLNDLILVE
jgi:hypothetical protein